MWKLRPCDDRLVYELANELDVSPLVARALATRGVKSADESREFLHPKLKNLRPPKGIADFDKGVERIAQAVRGGEKIGVFGDYDVDGATTTAVLGIFLSRVGVSAELRVANRENGYGFTNVDAQFFVQKQCSLVIIGDCGTSDGGVIATLQEQGIDVIVIDHHTVPNAGEVHPAYALINPRRTDSDFPFDCFASVGIAFYVTVATRTLLIKEGRDVDFDVRELLDIVAIGTIADMVPLVGENRILVAHGLKQMQVRLRPGIAEMMRDDSGVAGQVDERAVSWRIAPRLNAPGRMGAADLALRVLLVDEAGAKDAVARIETVNDERRAAQNNALEEAMELAKAQASNGRSCIVVAKEGWHPGVVGIVAARLRDEFGIPVFVGGIDDEGVVRGSCRSDTSVNLFDALSTGESLLQRFGGHAQAAGFTLEKQNLSEFAERMNDACAKSNLVATEIPIDAEVELRDLSSRAVRELHTLSPFGKDNWEPLLLGRGWNVEAVRRVGGEGKHLKLRLSSQGDFLSAIAFGQGGLEVTKGAVVDVGFVPTFNHWQGQTSVEARVEYLRVVG